MDSEEVYFKKGFNNFFYATANGDRPVRNIDKTN